MRNYILHVPITLTDDADPYQVSCVVDELLTENLDHNDALGVVVTGDSDVTYTGHVADPKKEQP